MKTKREIITQNNLWQARKRSHLERKQVSFLLSKKSNDELSLYERGLYVPNLQTAIKLELIYHTPVKLLFQNLFTQCRKEIQERKREGGKPLNKVSWFPTHAEKLTQEEFCFYTELLKNHVPSQMELVLVQKHSISLINVTSDYKQGRRPFAS